MSNLEDYYLQVQLVLHVSQFLSVNRLYSPGTRKDGSSYVRLSSKGRSYKQDMKYLILSVLHPEDRSLITSIRDLPVRVVITYQFLLPHDQMYCTTGKLRRIDLSNFCKALEDSLFDVLGIDDSTVCSLTMTKQSMIRFSTLPPAVKISAKFYPLDPERDSVADLKNFEHESGFTGKGALFDGIRGGSRNRRI